MFRGKKVLGDYDIKVEQVPLGFYTVADGFVESISFFFFKYLLLLWNRNKKWPDSKKKIPHPKKKKDKKLN